MKACTHFWLFVVRAFGVDSVSSVVTVLSALETEDQINSLAQERAPMNLTLRRSGTPASHQHGVQAFGKGHLSFLRSSRRRLLVINGTRASSRLL